MSESTLPVFRPRPNRPEPIASRPNMPDYGILPADSGSGLMPWSEASEKLRAARSYWIGTTRPDGRPHAAPVWGVWVDETFFFGSAPSSRKVRNLLANPAMVVHLESGDDVVILEGEAEVVVQPDSALWQRIADSYAAKYNDFRPDYPEDSNGGFYALRHRIAFGWLEPDYPGSATRWIFDQGK